jgi:hypothetical protein
VPYVTIIIPASPAIGKTVDAMIGVAPARVTLLSERTLRIEPNDVGSIIGMYSENSRTTIQAITSRRKNGASA